MITTHKFPDSFYREEVRAFVVDAETKRLWAALLDLLAEFDRVCRAHGIDYSIDGGTMLGKARHGGFIPWDDDVDVIIFRDDYEKLLKVADKEFRAPYFLQTMQSDPEAVRGHPILRNSSTTAILKDEFCDGKAIYKTFNQGLALDIFVLDGIPDDLRERESYFAELQHLKNMMIRSRNAMRDKLAFSFNPRRFRRFMRTLWNKVFIAWIKAFAGKNPLLYYSKLFDAACKRYAGVETRDVSHISYIPNPGRKYIMERAKLAEREDVDFEGLKVRMIKEVDHYLEKVYGNWRKYAIGATSHGGFAIDLDRPYTEYF